MYRIGILDQDESYLWRLVGYLKEYHNDTFEINVGGGGFGLDAVDIDEVYYDALFLGDGAEKFVDEDEIPLDTKVAYLVEYDTDDELCICRHQNMEKVYRQMKRLCEAGNAPKPETAADADGFVLRVIAENFKSKEEGEARRYLLRIRKFCDELMASMDFETADAEDGADEEYEEYEEYDECDGYGSTEEFDSLQKNARDSLEVKNRTKELGREEAVTYIIRKRTGEKVVINRNLFKMGKDASYVDYCVKDNPAVSRNHADIVRKPDGYYLVDKGSLNRTFVDGRKLEAGEYRKLDDGCLLQMADDVFEFRSLTN